MDKLDRNNTITIKLNNNDTEQPKQMEKEKVVEEPNLFQEEKQPVEQTKEELAAANHEKEEEFDWILPTTPVQTSKKKLGTVVTYSSNKKSAKKNNGSYTKFVAAIVCAVLVGLGFMYIALKTITASDTAKPASTVVQPEAEVVKKNEKEAASPQVGGATSVLPSMQIQVVQGGVYSNLDSAEKQKDLLENRDMPAVILPQQDKYYLLLFASDSLERAKAVSGRYKEKGIDSYWKEFKLGGNGQKKVTKENAQIVADATSLYKKLASAATTLMITSDKVDSSIMQSDLKKLEAQKDGSKEVLALIPPLQKAVEKISSTENAIDTSLAMQKPLLDFIRVYNTLVP